ncbi:LCP family protein [Corynebacterium pelargi]|uniref:Transcriptional regulator YwtF n=1 Tax=Corynebacterium pelargi TaxID=1471400 RepID=A0A410W609_9CORY|nr:LCP family protein [Corynebacterium pelargi]QAU51468.1 Putative transcriptional regulator YwtF [Corynebacterium pelargi]GGG79398.1 transcriptional regulator [Corynebacterium pelargi]
MDYVYDADGKPIRDRYGRPVRRRQEGFRIDPDRLEKARRARQQAGGDAASKQPPQRRPRRSQPEQAPRQQFPRQQVPPRQVPPQQVPPQQPAGREVPRQQYVAPSQFQPRQEYRRPEPVQVSPSIAQPAPKRARQPRRRPRLGCLGTLRWVVAAVVVLVLVGGLWVDAKLNRIDAQPPQHIANTAGTNWLLVGSDSRTDLSEEDVQRLGTGGDIGSMRTDTIMLLHLPTFGKATLLSIPRDSYVNIPGYGMDKINAAFSLGGAPLLEQTVEEATGLRIDHYAEIGMGGLANVVDAAGGIEVCPPEPIDDPLANLNIQAGCQRVDGPTALGYVRTRATSMGDLDRVQRQREFFSALVNKLTSPGTFLNPFRVLPTISTVAGAFTVDKKDHVWHLARVALAMHSGIETTTVPVGGFADTDVGNVVLWDEPAAQELFNSLR